MPVHILSPLVAWLWPNTIQNARLPFSIYGHQHEVAKLKLRDDI